MPQSKDLSHDMLCLHDIIALYIVYQSREKSPTEKDSYNDTSGPGISSDDREIPKDIALTGKVPFDQMEEA